LPYAAVDPAAIRPEPLPEGEELIVAHAPTDRVIKGTQHVIEAVDALRDEGVAIRLDLVEGVTRDVALERLAAADLLVDQLRLGWYGTVAVEAMALGRPVLSYIREDEPEDNPFGADLPIVRTTSATLVDDLRALSADRGRLRELGVAGRAFVEEHHDPVAIARRGACRPRAAAIAASGSWQYVRNVSSLRLRVLTALVVAPAALADGATLSQPANGSTVSSLAPIEFTWFNPHYHVLGIRQDLYVATDPAVQKIVAEYHDWCPPYELCPQGATIDALPPGTYYWKVHLFAWDWEPDSDTWSFLSAVPPPPLLHHRRPAPPPRLHLPPATRHTAASTLRSRPARCPRFAERRSAGKARHPGTPLSPRQRALRLVVVDAQGARAAAGAARGADASGRREGRARG
jgi:hypothetical protein